MERLLILGRGAREHALAHKALRSKRLEVYVAPGNAGMRPPIHRVPLEENQIAGLRDFIRAKQISYVLVGPELPLARGIWDDLHDLTVVVGPPQRLTFLEASKAKAKAFLLEADIPTAQAAIFDASQQAEAEQYLRGQNYPLVLKASGLAAGKGVFIASSAEEAIRFARACWSGQRFGTAGQTLVIEEFLQGEERSVFVWADGKGYTFLPTARDYKRLQDGDAGPNTGGMGAYAPAEDPKWLDIVREKVLEPTFHTLRKMGTSYQGFLYVGLMKVGTEPYVLEYNVRLGDPEAQVILPLIENDLEELLYYYRIQKLSELRVRVRAGYAVGVVAATAGYPEAPRAGAKISLPELGEGGSYLHERAFIYWAGVKEGPNEETLEATGGRTYTAVGLGTTLEEARTHAYQVIEKLPFEGRQFRSDIARL
uniref:phosphoribosylamine--glycine ligase n=1 Tax=uncultured Bacteroidota bacterium TaxID=152509 RepID=H5SNU8_9BACT|nr:phosphoribosylamine--glycine ligase [uncultured Bacteroidetes bacterium]